MPADQGRRCGACREVASFIVTGKGINGLKATCCAAVTDTPARRDRRIRMLDVCELRRRGGAGERAVRPWPTNR